MDNIIKSDNITKFEDIGKEVAKEVIVADPTKERSLAWSAMEMYLAGSAMERSLVG
jgi:hypothetical protein